MSTEKNKVGTLDTTQTWFERRGTGFPSKRALNAVDWFPAHRECTVPVAGPKLLTAIRKINSFVRIFLCQNHYLKAVISNF